MGITIEGLRSGQMRTTNETLSTLSAAIVVACLCAPIAVARGPFVVEDTGADRCFEATVIDIPVGPPGQPTSVTVSGDRTGMTGPDCGNLFTIAWWEAFHIDDCATVVLDFCGSSRPRVIDVFTSLVTNCDAGGTCGPFIAASSSTVEFCPSEPDFLAGAVSLRFEGLPPGTYFYALNTSFTPGTPSVPYTFTIRAEQCSGDCQSCLGACCDTADSSCEEDVSPTQCRGPTQQWTHRGQCCEIECRPPELEYDADGVTLLSRVPVEDFSSGSTRANDIWGYVSPSGREYAIIGLSEGTGFVEVTDPRNPVVLADIPDEPSTWSDMKTFKGYAYNVNERGGGLQVIDINGIDEGVVTLLGSAQGGLNTAHNVALNADSGFLYPCATNLVRGFLAYDLTDPADPVPVGSWNDATAHDLQVASYDDCPWVGRAGPCEIAFVFSGGSGMRIVDVTDKTDMTTISSLLYSTLRFSHQGWLSEDRRFLFANDESDERSFNLTTRTYVFDVSDLANPFEVRTFTNGSCAIDHNLMTRGRLVFEANYTSGLRVYDVGDIDAVQEIAHFDTFPAHNQTSFDGAWGVFAGFPSGNVLISDGRRGLFVLSACPDQHEPRADVDADGSVTLRDFAAIQRCFGQDPRGNACQVSDLDCDRDVDLGDLGLFVRHLNR